jgi:MFS family permease
MSAGSLALAASVDISSWLVAGRLLQGAGFALYVNGALALFGDALPVQRRSYGIGLFALSGNVALAVGPAAAEWLAVVTESYRTAFVLASMLALASVVAASRIRDLGSGVRSVAARWAVKSWWVLRLPVTLGVLQGGVLGALLVFVPADAAATGLTVAPFFVAYTVALASVRLAGGALLDRHDCQATLPGLLLVGALAPATLAVGQSAAQLIVSGVLFGFAHGLVYPMLSAVVLDAAPPEHRGRAISVFNLAFSIGTNLVVVLYGAFSDLFGRRAMFGLTAATLAIAAGYALLGQRQMPPPHQSE